MKSDIQLYLDFIKALKENDIVYLFGAGLSTALSGRKYTWWDWIVDGISRIKDYTIADMLTESLKTFTSKQSNRNPAGEDWQGIFIPNFRRRCVWVQLKE